MQSGILSHNNQANTPMQLSQGELCGREEDDIWLLLKMTVLMGGYTIKNVLGYVFHLSMHCMPSLFLISYFKFFYFACPLCNTLNIITIIFIIIII